MTWMERAEQDPSLRAFIDAEIARACVELQALRVEHARQAEMLKAQAAKIAAFEAEQRGARPKQRALKGNAA